MANILKSKNVRCPNCQAVLSVPNRQNKARLQFNCPRCKQLLVVDFLVNEEPDTDPGASVASRPQSSRPMEAHTVVSPNTVLPSKEKWPQWPGQLTCNGITHTLHDGKNTCGRNGSSSMSQFQFPADSGVSKEHFIINVSRRVDDTYLVTITPFKPRISYTTVDGLPMQYGDEIVLRDGSVIRAHNTFFTYTAKKP